MAKFNSMIFRIIDEDICKEATSSKRYFRYMTDGELELFKSGKVVKRGNNPYMGGTTGPDNAIFFLGTKTKCWDKEHPEIVRYLSPADMYICLQGIVSDDNLVEFETNVKPGKAIGTYSNIIDGWSTKKDIYPKFGIEYDQDSDMEAEEFYFTAYSKKDFKLIKVWNKPGDYDTIKINERLSNKHVYKDKEKCYNIDMKNKDKELNENYNELVKLYSKDTVERLSIALNAFIDKVPSKKVDAEALKDWN